MGQSREKEYCSLIHLGVLAIEKGVIESPSTKVANFTYLQLKQAFNIHLFFIELSIKVSSTDLVVVFVDLYEVDGLKLSVPYRVIPQFSTFRLHYLVLGFVTDN